MRNQAKSWMSEGDKVLMQTYARFPLVLQQGKGTSVTDVEGKNYLDFVSGIAVNALGHCDTRLVRQVQKQAATLLHVSNLYYNLPQITLAKRLVACSFSDKVFFCNSGAEAVEAAIKLVRKFAREKMAGDRYEIITADQSFHGRTMAALAATGQEKYQKGFEPLLPGFKKVPYGDADAIEGAITPRTAAVLLEPIQGEGGVRIPKPGYLSAVRKICDRLGLLLVFDEVQTGIGRTGYLFAYQEVAVIPDIMTLAKGLGGGLPIGAMLAREDVARSFQPGSHASTFGGNPLVCSAGIAVMDRMTKGESFLKNVRKRGAYLMDRLLKLQVKTPLITAVRGKGLMIAIDLAIPAQEVIESALKRGLLLNRTSEKTLRLLPPLSVKRAEIDQMLIILTELLLGKPLTGRKNAKA